MSEPPAYGRHGMAKNRFKVLRALFGQLHTLSEDELDPNDEWRYCRAPVDSFNEHYLEVFSPSWFLMLDECMAAWTGAEGVEPGVKKNSKPIPALSFLETKPEPLGAEMKAAACGEVGAINRLLIHLDKKHVGQGDQWYDEYGGAAAVVLHLLQPWFQSDQPGVSTPERVWGGDSAFTSVQTIENTWMEVSPDRLEPPAPHLLSTYLRTYLQPTSSPMLLTEQEKAQRVRRREAHDVPLRQIRVCAALWPEVRRLGDFHN